MMNKTWFLNIKSSPHAKATVLCLPCGGGSAASFWGWQSIPLDVNIWALKLPGRDNRISDEFITSSTELVSAIIAALPETFAHPYILYGHSMGAGLAFELLLALQKQRREVPVLFIAAGREPPDCEYRFNVNHLSDDDLINYVQSLGGVQQKIPTDSQFLPQYLAKIRADYQLNANIPIREPLLLPLSIAIVNGEADPLIHMEKLNGWSHYSTQPLKHYLLPGDHFFMNNNTAFLDIISDLLAECLQGKELSNSSV